MSPLEPDPNNRPNSAAPGADKPAQAKGPSDESERWLRKVLQNTSDIVTVLEADHTIRYVSPAIERVLGYRPEELVGTVAFDYVHPEDIEFVSTSFAEALKNPRVQPPIEFRLRAVDGSWRHVEVIRNNRLDDPAMRGIVTNVRDITERKRSEEKLRQSEQRLRAQYQGFPIPTFSWRRVQNDFELVDYNEAADEITRGGLTGLLGIKASEWYSQRPEILEMLSRCFREGITIRREIPWRMVTTGEHKHFAITFAYVPPDLVIHHAEDITERKQAEEEVRFQARLLDAVGQAVIATDLQGNIIYWNEAAGRLYGWSEEEVMGRPTLEVTPSEELLEQAGEIMSELGTGRSWSGEFEVRRKDGTSFPAMVTNTPVHNEQGNVVAIIGVSTDITELKKTEELRQSEERFRLLAENAQDLIFRYRLKPTPGFEYVSPSVTAITGYTPEEYYANPQIIEKLVHPDDRHIIEEALQRPEGPITLRCLRKDGEIVWTDQLNKPIYDEAGELVAIEGIVRDITERKKAEETLRETQEFMTGILENAPLPIYIVSEEGQFRLVNPFFADLVGVPQEKIIGSLLEDVFTEDEVRQFRENNRKVMETETPLITEEWAETPDGTRNFQTIKFPLRNPDSTTDAIGGISIEFTERKRAEEALRENEARFRSTFDEATIGMSLSKLDGRYVQVNRSLCEMLGYSEEELLATTFLSITHPDDLEMDLDYMRRMLEGEIDSFRTEKRYLHADGHAVWVSLGASVVRNPEGHPLYFIDQVQDITERKEAEEEKTRRARHTALRAEVSAAFAKGGALHSILQKFTECMVCHLGAAFARIWTLNEENNVLELQASAGMYTRLDGAYSRVPVGEYKIGLIAQERLPHLTNDVVSDPRVSDREWAEREGMVAFAGHPLVVEDQLVGVMAMFARKPLEEDTIEALASVAGIIAQGIERKRADEALRRSEANLAEAQRMVHLGSWEWDLKTGEVWWSDEAYRIYGFEAQQFSPTLETVAEVFHPDDRHLFRATIDGVSRGARSHDFEHRIVRPDGEVRWVHRRGEIVDGEGGESLRMIGTTHDITERKALEERLHHQAFHDLLTDLPNRQLFMDRLQQALRRTRRRQGRKVAMLFIDLDNFKLVNDSLGHEIGDRLLVMVAERLQGCLRLEDTLARFGGDEFTVLVEDVEGASDAEGVAKRIVECLQQPFAVDGRELFVTASIGIALGEARTKRPEELLRDADAAMYQAKGEGSLKYEVFEPGMHERVLERLQLENDLRRALENEEFRVYYQPIINLRTGEVWGVEALVRWEHPEQGLLSPARFIPLAEETGLIVPIGRRVLEEACEQAKEWQRRHPRIEPLVTCVNFSAKQLQHPDCVRTIEEALRKTGLKAGLLSLDITETVYVRAPAVQSSLLEQLKGLGVRVSIDDFGTGYSSISYLKRLPADDLKLDKSFVAGIGESAKDTAIARTVIDLAHTLGMGVIAEGVESADQAAQLKEMGCELAQGYHFAKPLPPEAISEFLAR